MKFMDSIRFCTLTATLGTADTLVSHPATTSHSNMSSDQRTAHGISEGLIRMSVGLEHPDDIIADIRQALQAI